MEGFRNPISFILNVSKRNAFMYFSMPCESWQNIDQTKPGEYDWY